MRIVLPWPDKRLSPNARGHWAGLHRAKKKARWDAAYIALEAMNGQAPVVRAAYAGEDPIRLQVTFYAPDAQRRDMDNMAASLKAAFDGLADALAVDDSRFKPEYSFGGVEKPGRVEVRFG